MRLLTFMGEIDRLVKDHSQFVIATHSPLLMAFPGADVLEFSPEGIRSVEPRHRAFSNHKMLSGGPGPHAAVPADRRAVTCCAALQAKNS
jgi:hypothetical protein